MPGKNPGPSIKDPERYEALRNKGYSKEAAARIANSDPEETAERGGSAPPYEERTVDELYDRAQDLGIDQRSEMDKAELISALREHREGKS